MFMGPKGPLEHSLPRPIIIFLPLKKISAKNLHLFVSDIMSNHSLVQGKLSCAHSLISPCLLPSQSLNSLLTFHLVAN